MPSTRRKFLLASAAAVLPARSEKGRRFDSEFAALKDPTTENQLVRLTDPGHTSVLPSGQNACLDEKGRLLLFSSDRPGAMQVFRMDLKSGESRQITDAGALDPASVTLLAGDRAFSFFDGDSLRLADMNGNHDREICRVREGYTREGAFSVSVDGLFGFFVEKRASGREIRMVDMRRGTLTTLVGRTEEVSFPQAWPARAALAYACGEEIWLVHYDGASNRRLRTAEPSTGAYLWDPGRRSLFYLTAPEKAAAVTIREQFPDTNEDKFTGRTTKYAAFDCNRDSSVFAGASASVASPHILLLFRIVDRELTICEHRCSRAADVRPMFSPNSQHVFFQSDREGKMAIYSIDVHTLVEETDNGTSSDQQ